MFPTENAIRYKTFFDIDRPFNRLLRDEELKKFKTKNVGNAGLNQAVRGLAELGAARKKEWGLWFLFFGGMRKDGYNLREKQRKSIF